MHFFWPGHDVRLFHGVVVLWVRERGGREEGEKRQRGGREEGERREAFLTLACEWRAADRN